jgi:hypothetical protein
MNNTPERQLWSAVILRAIEDYTTDLTQYKSSLAQKDALFWKNKAGFWLFRSKKANVGSLEWICKHIDLPIESVRSSIRMGIYDGKTTKQKTI